MKIVHFSNGYAKHPIGRIILDDTGKISFSDNFEPDLIEEWMTQGVDTPGPVFVHPAAGLKFLEAIVWRYQRDATLVASDVEEI